VSLDERSSWSQRDARGVVVSLVGRSSWSQRDAIVVMLATIVSVAEPRALVGAYALTPPTNSPPKMAAVTRTVMAFAGVLMSSSFPMR
jgi:hypothetical protein